MRIEQATLTEIRVPLRFRFETSFGATDHRRVILVHLQTSGAAGVAECVAGDLPTFSSETVDSAWATLKTHLIPAVLGKELVSPTQLGSELAWVRGNEMAKAALECALWDAYGRTIGEPLGRLLGGVRTEVPVGISLGIQPSIAATLDQVEQGVSAGYRRIKLKIKPGWDVEPVRAVRERFPDISLTTDANSAYTLIDLPVMRELDRWGLDYIEQPLAHDDLHDHAVLQELISTPICLDESIRSSADTRKALASGSGRVINIKIGRVGGLSVARQIHDVAQAFSVPVWCGGMLETGVGRAFNLAIASLPNFTKPGDTASSSRYWERDIIHEPLEAGGGFSAVPPGPGSGVTVDWDYVAHLTVRHEAIG